METPNPEELLRKIEELESAHANLRDEMSKLALPHAQTAILNAHPHSYGGAIPFQRDLAPLRDFHPPLPHLHHMLYLNILQSMGQAIHIMNSQDRLIYWNRPAEKLYGYTAAEVLGKTVFEVMVDDENVPLGSTIVNRVKTGESWAGLFPVRSKSGRRFSILVTDSPVYDEDGTLIGVACIASDSKPFEQMRHTLPGSWNSESDVNFSRPRNCAASKLGLDPDQPLQAAISSKITDLATKVSNKVRSKMKFGKPFWESEAGSSYICRQGDYESSDETLFHHEDDTMSYEDRCKENAALSFMGEQESKLSKDWIEESEERTAISKITSRAEAWINKKTMKWPGKGNEQELSEARPPQFGWVWVQRDLDHDQSSSPSKSEHKSYECSSPVIVEAPWSWSSPLNVSTSSSKTSCGSTSTSSSSAKKLDMETDSLDFEVLWEDLIFKAQIGQGSCGTVYHGFWCGSFLIAIKHNENNFNPIHKSSDQEVAIKVFSKVEYSEDAIFAFRQEVSLMKGLRHPNILLFMGAVTSPEHLCIITEFLPRGSLFRLLQRKLCKLDWRRRVHMAVDIARGMNYLHCCNPPIVHRDLKSSNLLVDKNWNVKVADFGLSRIKYETYLTTKTGKGTPQWMAPEVLRHEPSDEKSDIYSFGVILWELATEKAPWESLNAMQVIGAVGFMNQRLEIPSNVDMRWAAIIESCWRSDPRDRPSFQELLKMLKDLARQYSLKHEASKSNSVDIALQDQ